MPLRLGLVVCWLLIASFLGSCSLYTVTTVDLGDKKELRVTPIGRMLVKPHPLKPADPPLAHRVAFLDGYIRRALKCDDPAERQQRLVHALDLATYLYDIFPAEEFTNRIFYLAIHLSPNLDFGPNGLVVLRYDPPEPDPVVEALVAAYRIYDLYSTLRNMARVLNLLDDELRR